MHDREVPGGEKWKVKVHELGGQDEVPIYA